MTSTYTYIHVYISYCAYRVVLFGACGINNIIFWYYISVDSSQQNQPSTEQQDTGEETEPSGIGNEPLQTKGTSEIIIKYSLQYVWFYWQIIFCLSKCLCVCVCVCVEALGIEPTLCHWWVHVSIFSKENVPEVIDSSPQPCRRTLSSVLRRLSNILDTRGQVCVTNSSGSGNVNIELFSNNDGEKQLCAKYCSDIILLEICYSVV